MSYRNPGEIYIANPNAFMQAFEKGIAPIKAELERKAAERKERAQKYDLANAKLKQNLQYPEWVKKYGKQKADTIKSIVEEDYISNNKFASATQSEQQDMLDELNTSITSIAQKTDAALQIDFNEILPGQFEDNPEFLDFIENKPAIDNNISLEKVNGQMGFSYIKDGKKSFLSVDKIPDGAIGYQGRSQVYDVFEAGIKDAVKQVDDHVRKAGEATSMKNKLARSANNIFAQINDPSQRAYLFELAQSELKDQEEGKVDYSYMDIIDNDNLREAADGVILEYIQSRIEDDSAEIDGIKQAQKEQQERERKAAEAAAAKVKTVDPLEKRTGLNAQDREIAFKNIVNLKPGEDFVFKYKGSNDVEKKEYIMKKKETGEITFEENVEGSVESKITVEDLAKEFGLQLQQPEQTQQETEITTDFSQYKVN